MATGNSKGKDCCTLKYMKYRVIAGRSGCGDASRQPKNEFTGYKEVRDEARNESNMLQRLETEVRWYWQGWDSFWIGCARADQVRSVNVEGVKWLSSNINGARAWWCSAVKRRDKYRFSTSVLHRISSETAEHKVPCFL